MSTGNWMSKLTKDFGVIAADMPDITEKIIKTPSPSLNWAVGNGGFVEGKSICLFGPESGGKSLLMQLILIDVQKRDSDAICILFDAEMSFQKEWFAKLGGDTSRLIIRKSNDPIKIFDYMSPEGELYEMLQQGAPIRAVAIDSVKSIRYPKDIKSKTTDQVMGGGGASYLGPALKGVLPVIREFNITTVMVQQVYEEMDQYKKMRNPYIVPDGRALKHFCDYMLQVDKLETKAGVIESGKDMIGGTQQVGHKIRVKCKKNRTAAPYRTAQLTLCYSEGITDVANEIFDLAKSLDIIFHPVGDNGKPNTQMWQFADYEKVRGEANMRQWLIDNPNIQQEMVAACNAASEAAIKTRNELMETVDVDLDQDS